MTEGDLEAATPPEYWMLVAKLEWLLAKRRAQVGACDAAAKENAGPDRRSQPCAAAQPFRLSQRDIPARDENE